MASTCFRAAARVASAASRSAAAGRAAPFAGRAASAARRAPCFSRADMALLDSCNGLLLLRYSASCQPVPFFNVVCNPTNRQWVALPEPSHAVGMSGFDSDDLGEKPKPRTLSAALAFDPAVSPHFHVFQLVGKYRELCFTVEAVEIYSSEARKWSLRQSGWSEPVVCSSTRRFAYLDGFLHFATSSDAVAAVDTAGEAWRVTRVRPRCQMAGAGLVGRSQGRLLYVDACKHGDGDALSVYALEDPEEWTLKQSVTTLELLGPRKKKPLPRYSAVAFHPDCNVIFIFDGVWSVLMAYDMDRKDVSAMRANFTEASRYHPLFSHMFPCTRGQY
ncbi:hypothetical protein BAE44_0014912 [Dichanthelium oligosanthes]|uniref:F-box protein At3g26010-like beta-propeller domain-containing protein n=1 Tax=Dichanthelium oligosanthes TaxID=888268 RepID=A0A1E5VFZ5_9POAL|nr:hypothetical protein BAE44_0014912 [Dichanthelium oligosanthes]